MNFNKYKKSKLRNTIFISHSIHKTTYNVYEDIVSKEVIFSNPKDFISFIDSTIRIMVYSGQEYTWPEECLDANIGALHWIIDTNQNSFSIFEFGKTTFNLSLAAYITDCFLEFQYFNCDTPTEIHISLNQPDKVYAIDGPAYFSKAKKIVVLPSGQYNSKNYQNLVVLHLFAGIIDLFISAKIYNKKTFMARAYTLTIRVNQSS